MSNESTGAPTADNEPGYKDNVEFLSHKRASYWLAAIIESAEDAIVSKTLEGRITSWNQGAERLFGYTAKEAIGQLVTMLIPAGHYDEEPEILARIKAGHRVEHYETVRIRKGGQLINVSLTVSPIRDSEGKVIGASKIARDITKLKQIEKEREQLLRREKAARQHAEEANRLKEEFLATISHELRTPLTSILGWAHMLRLGKLDADGIAKALETIEKNARAQTQLIDDLLDVSRVIAGKFQLDVSPVDPSSFIEAAIETARPAAEAKGVRIQKILDPAVGSVPGDSIRLQQVVWNLISNAVKFTPMQGLVQISLQRFNSHVEIKVSDTGVGISPEFLPLVFDRFSQADQRKTRRLGGLGLGLAIVRHLVELHGGTVRAQSPGEGQGSTFTVTLPIMPVYQVNDAGAPEHLAPGEASKSYESIDRLDGLKVLVVDDELDTRELLKEVLSQCGAEVLVAESVVEALKIVSASPPDLLISDIGMPDEDGYELIRRVRELPVARGGKVPAIALTAYARLEDRMEALRAGYQMHVPKPVELAELAAVASSLTRRV